MHSATFSEIAQQQNHAQHYIHRLLATSMGTLVLVERATPKAWPHNAISSELGRVLDGVVTSLDSDGQLTKIS